MLPVSFLPSATNDLKAVYSWYEKERKGLGQNFIQEVLNQVEQLQKNIMVHRFFFGNIRYVRLRKFPYSIFYFISETNDRIVIAAILGNKQDMLKILQNRI